MPCIHVCQILEATVGGTRRHLNDLVFGLDQKRFQLSVICSALRDPDFQKDVERMRQAGIGVHVIPMRREISPPHDALALLHLFRLLRRFKPDIVHCHSAKAGFLSRLAAALLRITNQESRIKKVVYTPHAFPFIMDVSPLRRRFYLALERFAARLTDAIICVSESERQAALEAGLCSKEKLTVIENGVDPTEMRNAKCEMRNQVRRQLGVPEDALVIGCVADFRAQKGHRYLVEASPLVLRDTRHAAGGTTFVLIGDGKLRPAMEALCEKLGVRENFIFTGRREDARQLYAAFDLYVLPSLWEGCPYTLLEAMASGLAVVATDVVGNRDIVRHNENGLLVPPRSPKALAQAIVELLHDEPRRQAMGERGRWLVEERFSLSAMLQKTQALYKFVIRDSRFVIRDSRFVIRDS